MIVRRLLLLGVLRPVSWCCLFMLRLELSSLGILEKKRNYLLDITRLRVFGRDEKYNFLECSRRRLFGAREMSSQNQRSARSTQGTFSAKISTSLNSIIKKIGNRLKLHFYSRRRLSHITTSIPTVWLKSDFVASGASLWDLIQVFFHTEHRTHVVCGVQNWINILMSF